MKRLIIMAVATSATFSSAIFGGAGCSATNESELDPGTTVTAGPSGGGMGGMTGAGAGDASTTGDGGSTFTTTGGGEGGMGGSVFMDPCDSQCGEEELCEDSGLAIDDDCDGVVDEGCGCSTGSVQPCFKGDPSYKDATGCFAGSQKCNELGQWGPCEGGVHATELCFQTDASTCSAIESPPFVTADLKPGTGTFSADAITETWTVACPAGVDPCPAVMGSAPADDFTPLVSGEYTVTYTKTTANGSDSCTYPLFVGAPGLRVELSWDWDENLGSSTVDLDLHVHKPGDTNPWGGSGGSPEDCAYSNCTAFAFGFGSSLSWFNGVAPPDPVNWYLDPVPENNTCYYGPKGNGQEWQSIGMGCHNPRLDVDNITCDPTVTDPQSTSFCNAENINIDFPPKDQWTRIGVHYFSNQGQTYPVHPVVKIYCNGRLAAELGETGFAQPVTFPSTDGSDRFWLVADVLFQDNECAETCVVDPKLSTLNPPQPLFTDVNTVVQSVGPSYPPIPNP